ncbi:MarR family winged helix-turn-helix transcriptional regulator [Paraburkholderia caribensis]|uniref:MarR family winged helix-turn-helix transcriptional regulator n=1 Tax=Paraburkholderia caribensis TaxID=75105 RepID=UPI001CC5279D|nr:MarR family transcriptional regulator [Paraburkholderia caribensis]
MGNADFTKMWSLHYRLITSVIGGVAPTLADLGLEVKELFMLAEIDEHPHPAELAGACLMPKPTVTLYVKRLEAAGYLKRELDSADLRRHRLTLTADGRKAMMRGMAMLATAFGERLDRLNAAEQQALHRLLERLV